MPVIPRLSRARLGIGLLVITALVSGCRPNQSVEGQARDATIKTAIKAKLAGDVGATTLTAVEVNVTNGVVTLAGPVHNEDEKSRAEAAARSVEGVVSVTNALQILATERPPGVTAAPAATATPTAGP